MEIRRQAECYCYGNSEGLKQRCVHLQKISISKEGNSKNFLMLQSFQHLRNRVFIIVEIIAVIITGNMTMMITTTIVINSLLISKLKTAQTFKM